MFDSTIACNLEKKAKAQVVKMNSHALVLGLKNSRLPVPSQFDSKVERFTKKVNNK